MKDDTLRIQPRGLNVLIRRLKMKIEPTKTSGGIQLPDAVKRAFFRAEVLALGDGHTENGIKVPIQNLRVGDTVLVQDDVRGPGGRVMSRHLIPVTPDGDTYLVIEGVIQAVEAKGD